jgi:hypothetical protein
MNHEERTLEKLRVGVTKRLSRHLLDASVNLDMADQIVMSITGYIWQEKLDHVEISYPADWRQAFKERWFPTWLLNRYPVIRQTHTFDMAALYPDYKPIIQPHIMALRHYVYENDRLVKQEG